MDQRTSGHHIRSKIATAVVGVAVFFGASASDAGCPREYGRIGETTHAILPTVLTRTESVPLEHKVLDIRRLLHATNVIELNGAVSSRLEHLPNGNYVYAIVSEKRLVLMPRTLNPGPVDLTASDATFLGSHEGITHYLRTIYHADPQYLAAGEITIRNGRVMMVSNGSGTYRGGTEHLTYAIRELKEHGLAINTRTEARDYSVKIYSDPHGKAPGQAIAEIEASRDPGFAQLQRVFRSVMKKVDDKFPNPTDFVYAAISVKDREAQGRLLEAAGVISGWESPGETEAYVIRNTVRVFGERDAPKAKADDISAAGEAHLKSLLKALETFVDHQPAPKSVPALNSRAAGH